MDSAIAHADFLATFHTRYGIIPDYEKILEYDYRRLITPGDTVVDVGAHTGTHTVVFCELVGPDGTVLAFEPLPPMFAALEARKLGAQACLVNAALSDKAGRANFVYARGTPWDSGLRQRVFNDPEHADPITIEVEVFRLDDFLPDLRALKYIKIDTEGGEIGCLRGAVETLRRFRPYVSVEYGVSGYGAYGHTKQTLFEFAASLDYVMGDLFGAVCNDADSWERICDRSYWDWFMIPRERIGEWQQRLTS